MLTTATVAAPAPSSVSLASGSARQHSTHLLTCAFAEAMGVSADSLSPSADVFALGASSETVVRAMEAIRRLAEQIDGGNQQAKNILASLSPADAYQFATIEEMINAAESRCVPHSPAQASGLSLANSVSLPASPFHHESSFHSHPGPYPIDAHSNSFSDGWRRVCLLALQMLGMAVILCDLSFALGLAYWITEQMPATYITNVWGRQCTDLALFCSIAGVTHLALFAGWKTILPPLRDDNLTLGPRKASASLLLLAQYYFVCAHWRTVRIAIAPFFGTELYNCYLRMLGASIGRQCWILTGNIDAPELLRVGDHCYIAQQVVLHAGQILPKRSMSEHHPQSQSPSPHEHHLSSTQSPYSLSLASITIENGSVLCTGSVCAGGSRVAASTTVLSQECVDPLLSPSSRSEFANLPAVPTASNADVAPRHFEPRSIGMHLFQSLFPFVMLLVVLQPTCATTKIAVMYSDQLLTSWLFQPGTAVIWYLLAPAWLVLWQLANVVSHSALVRLLGILVPVSLSIRLQPHVGSWLFLLHTWLPSCMLQYMALAEHTMRISQLDAFWLWLQGATVEKNSVVVGPLTECVHCMPQLIVLKQGSFTAGEVVFGGVFVDSNGSWRSGKIIVGQRAFVGNRAILESGTMLPSHSEVGSLTLVRPELNDTMHEAFSHLPAGGRLQIFGAPLAKVMRMPPSTVPEFDDQLLPAWSVHLLGGALVIIATVILCLITVPPILMLNLLASNVVDTYLLMPVAIAIFVSLLAFAIILMHRLLLSQYRSNNDPQLQRVADHYGVLAVHPYQSFFFHFRWQSEFVFRTHPIFVLLVDPLLGGTALGVALLRSLGARIGSDVFLADLTNGPSELGLIQIEDGAVIESFSLIQTHTAEGRLLKMAPIRIGPLVTLGHRSMVHYGVYAEAGSRVLPCSLILKFMNLQPKSLWCGVPPAQWSQQMAQEQQQLRKKYDGKHALPPPFTTPLDATNWFLQLSPFDLAVKDVITAPDAVEPIDAKQTPSHPIPGFTGRVVTRGVEAEYAECAYQYASSSFGHSGAMQPRMILYATNEEDVVRVVHFAREQRIAVAIRSGGHSYCGSSSTDGDNIQLDMSAFSRFEYNAADGTVDVGVGMTLGELRSKLQSLSLFMPHGQCPFVCVGGHVQTGGFSYLLRAFGLFHDRLVSFRMITADGEIHHISEDTSDAIDRELWFATLGGSPGNFGVITEVKMRPLRDADHPNARAFAAYYILTEETLAGVTQFLVNVSEEADNNGCGWDAGLTVWSSLEKPGLSKFLQEKSNSEAPILGFMVVEAQWSNLLGIGEEYDASFLHRLKSACSACPLAVICDDAQPHPISSLIAILWMTSAKREFNMPYVRRERGSAESQRMREKGFAEHLAKRCVSLARERNKVGCEFTLQFMPIGGSCSRFQEFRKHHPSALSWADSKILYDLVVFYDPNHVGSLEYATEFQRQTDETDIGPDGVFCLSEHCWMWGASCRFSDIADAPYRESHYESKKLLERLRALKHHVDPEDVFSAHRFGISEKRNTSNPSSTRSTSIDTKPIASRDQVDSSPNRKLTPVREIGGYEQVGFWDMEGKAAGWSFLRYVYQHVLRTPAAVACVWLDDNGKEALQLNYSQLWALSARTARELRQHPSLQEPPSLPSPFVPHDFGGTAALSPHRHRVLLCFSFGLEFIVGFLGCLLADLIAVPVSAPNPTSLRKSLVKMNATIGACDAKLALTDPKFNRFRQISEIGEKLKFGKAATRNQLNGADLAMLQTQHYTESNIEQNKFTSGWPKLQWMEIEVDVKSADVYIARQRTDEIALDTFPAAHSQPLHIAFLQFSSGSTGLPKGIAVTHRALVHNVSHLQRFFLRIHQGEPIRFTGFLPPYHDFGLIAQHLASLFGGSVGYFFSPLAFIADPMLWPRMLSQTKATISGTPNFVLDLTSRKYALPKKSDPPIDLTNLRLLMWGSEQCRISTAEAFVDKFAKHGLPIQSLYSGYGMAENVFAGTMQGHTKLNEEGEPVLEWVCSSKNPQLISLGNIAYSLAEDDLDVRVVQPEKCVEVGEGEIGEIWISSPSLAAGYWGRPEITQETFYAKLKKAEKSTGAIQRDGRESLPEATLFSPSARSDPLIKDEKDADEIQISIHDDPLAVAVTELKIHMYESNNSHQRIPSLLPQVPSQPSSASNQASASSSSFLSHNLPYRRYLRTGDEGYIIGGRLFLCGRIKDLIIYRGEKHYPQDIELTVQNCSELLRPGCIAAFAYHDAVQREPLSLSSTNAAEEHLIVCAELRASSISHTAGETLANSIRSAILQSHGLQLRRLLLLPPRSIAKTSSGKIARFESRIRVRHNEYKAIIDQRFGAEGENK